MNFNSDNTLQFFEFTPHVVDEPPFEDIKKTIDEGLIQAMNASRPDSTTTVTIRFVLQPGSVEDDGTKTFSEIRADLKAETKRQVMKRDATATDIIYRIDENGDARVESLEDAQMSFDDLASAGEMWEPAEPRPLPPGAINAEFKDVTNEDGEAGRSDDVPPEDEPFDDKGRWHDGE